MRSSYRQPSLGEGFVRRYSFSTYTCICSDNARKAVFSFRCLPHGGRGTAPAVDKVLSLMAYLRRSSSPLFHPARTLSGSPRSPPSTCGEGFVSGIAVFSFRCLPHWGRGTASAVDRVLSLTAHLRRSSSPLFHTARTLSGSLRSPPSPRGEGFVSRKAVSPYRSLVFSSLRVRMYPHRLSISPRNPRA